jgi:exonuclease III
MGVSNKETVIYNYYQKLVTKNQGWRIDYENDIMKN